jgi:hypothetical protein
METCALIWLKQIPASMKIVKRVLILKKLDRLIPPAPGQLITSAGR